MKVCVVGSGGREHALCHVLSRTAEVIATPGNPGISGRSAEGHLLSSTSAPAEQIEADLYVIGPEQPLVEGLADRLRAKGKAVFGPSRDGARLEGSKAFMKKLAAKAGVPSAAFAVFESLAEAQAHLRARPGPYVIKTDGLAAGKGVLVTDSLKEALGDVADKLSGRSFGQAGRRVVIEDALVGTEASLLVLLDGKRAVALPVARDFKRLEDNDRGPNTGGMGAYAPVEEVTSELVGQAMEAIVEPTLAALLASGIDYRGVLYAGLMLTSEGPKLIEYNVRFGDPEAQALLPLVRGDLADLLAQAAHGALQDSLAISPGASLCVSIASAGYPAEPRNGDRIHGLATAGTVEGVTVFHCGTAREQSGALVSAGGRVLCVQGLGSDLAEARERAYRGVGAIDFAGMHYRNDIGQVGSSVGKGSERS